MNPYAHVELKGNFRTYFDISMLLALLAHMLGMLISPPLKLTPYVPPEQPPPPPIVWENPIVPLPPVDVRRPPIPITSLFAEIVLSDEADLDETIQDTSIDIENPTAARLDYLEFDGGSGDFQSFEIAPMEKKIYRPVYPVLARKAGIEASLIARVYIDEKGKVLRVRIEGSPPEIFIAPVVEALMKSEFYPAMQREIPVPCSILVPFDFFLSR